MCVIYWKYVICLMILQKVAFWDASHLRRDSGLLSSVKTVKDYRDFWSFTKCILHYMARSLWRPGSGVWWFEWTMFPTGSSQWSSLGTFRWYSHARRSTSLKVVEKTTLCLLSWLHICDKGCELSVPSSSHHACCLQMSLVLSHVPNHHKVYTWILL